LRAIADMIGQVVSLLLGSLGETEALAARFDHMSILRLLADRLAAQVPLLNAFSTVEAELLTLVNAAGAVVRLSGKVVCLGRTPPLVGASVPADYLKSKPVASNAIKFLKLSKCTWLSGSAGENSIGRRVGHQAAPQAFAL
jgi:light-regulated signal transduction histidine kinase (bacteriophytochrome)